MKLTEIKHWAINNNDVKLINLVKFFSSLETGTLEKNETRNQIQEYWNLVKEQEKEEEEKDEYQALKILLKQTFLKFELIEHPDLLEGYHLNKTLFVYDKIEKELFIESNMMKRKISSKFAPLGVKIYVDTTLNERTGEEELVFDLTSSLEKINHYEDLLNNDWNLKLEKEWYDEYYSQFVKGYIDKGEYPSFSVPEKIWDNNNKNTIDNPLYLKGYRIGYTVNLWQYNPEVFYLREGEKIPHKIEYKVIKKTEIENNPQWKFSSIEEVNPPNLRLFVQNKFKCVSYNFCNLLRTEIVWNPGKLAQLSKEAKINYSYSHLVFQRRKNFQTDHSYNFYGDPVKRDRKEIIEILEKRELDPYIELALVYSQKFYAKKVNWLGIEEKIISLHTPKNIVDAAIDQNLEKISEVINKPSKSLRKFSSIESLVHLVSLKQDIDASLEILYEEPVEISKKISVQFENYELNKIATQSQRESWLQDVYNSQNPFKYAAAKVAYENQNWKTLQKIAEEV